MRGRRERGSGKHSWEKIYVEQHTWERVSENITAKSRKMAGFREINSKIPISDSGLKRNMGKWPIIIESQSLLITHRWICVSKHSAQNSFQAKSERMHFCRKPNF